MSSQDQRGNTNPLLISSIFLGVLTVGLLVFGIWAFINYMDQKNNVDAKISDAVATAKKQQTDTDEAAFAEREKQPTRQLIGPVDLGKVTVSYPKTWSVYVDKDGTTGAYAAYMHPGSVQSVSQKITNAVLVSVDDKKYEDSLKSYDSQVAKGDLRASAVKVGDLQGTRLDGTFSKDIQGAVALFKLRDKTVKIAVQLNDYMGDFNNIILPSLKFNP